MYTVYHIPSKRYVGCTNNLDRRMLGSYGHGIDLNEVEILWESDDIVDASIMEQWEQYRIYGASDNRRYHEHQHQSAISARNSSIGRKMSIIMMGDASWNRGKKLSDAHKEKIKKAHIGRKNSESAKAKMSAARKGAPKSDEFKRKLAETFSAIKTCCHCGFVGKGVSFARNHNNYCKSRLSA